MSSPAAQNHGDGTAATKLPNGSAPATTTPHPAATEDATRRPGRPAKRWTLKQHVAHDDMAHLKWELEDTKCDGCGCLLYRSYFILRHDHQFGYRRFEEELEACEVCAAEAPPVPVLPVPPLALQLHGQSLAVNNNMAIAKRGTQGGGGNLRTTKVKHVPRNTTSGPAATGAEESKTKTAGSRGTNLGAWAATTEDGSVVAVRAKQGKASQKSASGTQAQSAGGQNTKSLEKLDAAAEYRGVPYGRLTTRDEECPIIWQLATTKNRFNALKLGDMTVSAATMEKAFDALAAPGAHPVYKAIRERGEKQRFLDSAVDRRGNSGMAIAGTKRTLKRAGKPPDQTWFKVEATSKGGGKLLASFSALHRPPEELSNQVCVLVPEWASYAPKDVKVVTKDDGTVRACVFLRSTNPGWGPMVAPIINEYIPIRGEL